MSIIKLKPANCKNCYKCVRYCPVKAIEIKSGQANILENECILCGKCMVVCPQNAKQVRSDREGIENAMKAGKHVYAQVAPSFIADFPVESITQIEAVNKQLGFYETVETAQGANYVKTQYEEILKTTELSFVISSCCHTINEMICKRYPALIPNLADVVTPMEATARNIKEQDSKAFVVFIGPCISKKKEGDLSENVDSVITFEEYAEWMADKNIDFPELTKQDERKRSRYFPKSGGIIDSMDKENDWTYICIDGTDQSIFAMEEMMANPPKKAFIEMSACKGGCINGPAIRNHRRSLLSSQAKVNEYAFDGTNSDFDVSYNIEGRIEFKNEYAEVILPGKDKIDAILREMNKFSPADELNCGSCGYKTCRDKAIAVYQGKADISMCLPFMKDRAESMSHAIIKETPNGIITVDRDFKIRQINPAALEVFNMTSSIKIVGNTVENFIDIYQIAMMFENRKSVYGEKMYLSDYGKNIEVSMIYEEQNDIVIIVLKDITEQEKVEQNLKISKEKAIEITDAVIEKQMKTVQEIAFLLGETTAETKVALNRLKASVAMEEDQ